MLLIVWTMPPLSKPSAMASRLAEIVIARVSTEPIDSFMASRS